MQQLWLLDQRSFKLQLHCIRTEHGSKFVLPLCGCLHNDRLTAAQSVMATFLTQLNKSSNYALTGWNVDGFNTAEELSAISESTTRNYYCGKRA